MTEPPHAVPHPGTTGHDSTRDRLIDAISIDGPIAAGELAERFGLTGAAVRRHLTQLEADGIIQEREHAGKSRGRGRPRKEFVLAAQPSDSEVSECEELALLAMAELHRAGGDAALHRLAQRRTDAWEREFASRLRAHEKAHGEASPAVRASLVVNLLHELGYAASLRPVTVELQGGTSENSDKPRTLTTVQLCQGRCPVQEIAAEHPALCEVETNALARMLGLPARRLATRAAGAHVCTTHLTPVHGRSIVDVGTGSDVSGTPTDLPTEGRKP